MNEPKRMTDLSKWKDQTPEDVWSALGRSIASEAEKDKVIKELADALDRACSLCHGKRTWDSSCSLCGDSGEDHVCNDKTYPCDRTIHAQADAARAGALP